MPVFNEESLQILGITCRCNLRLIFLLLVRVLDFWSSDFTCSAECSPCKANPGLQQQLQAGALRRLVAGHCFLHLELQLRWEYFQHAHFSYSTDQISSIRKQGLLARLSKVARHAIQRIADHGLCVIAALLAGTWMRASKLASYGMIFSALLTQLAYVKVLVGEEELEEEGPIDVTNNED